MADESKDPGVPLLPTVPEDDTPGVTTSFPATEARTGAQGVAGVEEGMLAPARASSRSAPAAGHFVEPQADATEQEEALTADLFRDQFDQLQRAFSTSLEKQGVLIDQIRTLKDEIVTKTTKLQWAYQLKVEDERTIEALRAELNQANSQRDTALEKEATARELISRLQMETTRLRSQVADLQSDVARLTDEAPVLNIKRPALMIADQALQAFDDWAQENSLARASTGGHSHSHSHHHHGSSHRSGRGDRRRQHDDDAVPPSPARPGTSPPYAQPSLFSSMSSVPSGPADIPPPSALEAATPMQRASKSLFSLTGTAKRPHRPRGRLPTLEATVGSVDTAIDNALAQPPVYRAGHARDPFGRVVSSPEARGLSSTAPPMGGIWG